MASMGKAMMGTGESEGDGRAMKATDMAISNPLIDDYTLKGAKGLLVNITGGKDLKLFEVDEVVNKIRSEVEADAEVIIGAITDASLEGKIRVSIVATSLDNQQPESKSVVNMVHRIQNRNTGYSDFENNNSTTQFSFSSNVSNPVSHGANALKLENEVDSENFSESVNDVNNEYNEELLRNQDAENVVDNTSKENEVSFSKEILENAEGEEENFSDLKEFGVDTDEPDLFTIDSDNYAVNSEDLLGSSDDNTEDDDDLEIPAFLRRQKN
jgi:cell division protein FtsZ